MFDKVIPADSTANTQVKHVTGNKADAAASGAASSAFSLVAYIKAIYTIISAGVTAVVPTADSTANVYSRDVVGAKDDAAVNAVGTTKSIIGSLKARGAGSATGAGTLVFVKKTLTSSGVVTGGIDVTLASSGGALELVSASLQTDGTGLAAGTAFQLVCNNAKGAALFMSTAVSGLGANGTIDLDNASVAHKKFVLESGCKITAKSTVADCTGAGTVDVYLTFRRLAAGAALAAA